MKKLTIAMCYTLFLSTFIYAQNYSFNGQMSREVLENYLERAITMQDLSRIPNTSTDEMDRLADIAMLEDIEAKFIGRITGWWGADHGLARDRIDRAEQNVDDIKQRDPEAICQAAIFEFVSTAVNGFTISGDDLEDFGLPAPQTSRNFNFNDMLYPAGTVYYNPFANTGGAPPDITRQETQLWFFYLAKTYIDIGFEALHFGQIELMDNLDTGNQAIWSLLQKIRAYAATKNRGIVLIDAHVPSGGLYYTPPGSSNSNILLFDFHSYPVRYDESPSLCADPLYPIVLTPTSANLYNRSLGGKNPLGWECISNPYLVEIDNGKSENLTGCTVVTPGPSIYGWDEIDWYGNQPEAYRNQVLIYSYFKIKCMDKNGHFQMPGRRGFYNISIGDRDKYKARTLKFNQQTTIKGIWQGTISPSPQTWLSENFTRNEVLNYPSSPNASKELVYVGTDKIYYIGTDNRIHGYIKSNGVWKTVSPSYAAGSVSQQVKVSRNLIANPSGTYLYYTGIDDLVYRYKINDVWSYTYSAMPTNNAMLSQNVRVNGDMVLASDNRIYYVAKEMNNNNAKRIHGFVKSGSNWYTTSPSWSAGNVSSQVQAVKELAVNPSGTFIIYRGTNQLFYKLDINSNYSYSYAAMPTNSTMIAQNIRATGALICPTNNRIYYIGNELENNHNKRIHGFIKSGSNWYTTSPTWSAGNVSSQAPASNTHLSASPDNTKIAYLGNDDNLHGFTINNNWSYSYFNFPSLSTNSFEFSSENKIQLINNQEVHQFYFGEDHCSNPIIDQTEPSGFSRLAPQNEDIAFGESDEFKENDPFKVYPNPTTDLLNVQLPSSVELNSSQLFFYDALGALVKSLNIEQGAPSTKTIDLQDFAQGLYYVVYINSGKASSQKLLIIK